MNSNERVLDRLDLTGVFYRIMLDLSILSGTVFQNNSPEWQTGISNLSYRVDMFADIASPYLPPEYRQKFNTLEKTAAGILTQYRENTGNPHIKKGRDADMKIALRVISEKIRYIQRYLDASNLLFDKGAEAREDVQDQQQT